MATAASVSTVVAATSAISSNLQHRRYSFRRNAFMSLSVAKSNTARHRTLYCTPLFSGSPTSSVDLNLLCISTVRKPHQARRGRRRGRVAYASLFGVGAPEALVIGVVALLVFGPKGLAEVARNLGKTLRAFQPTIKELQEVSKEFKSTLEREIGLDEVQSSLQSTYMSRTSSTENTPSSMYQNEAQPYKVPYSSDDLLKITQEQLAASEANTQARVANFKENLQAGETTTTTTTEFPVSPATLETPQTSSSSTLEEAFPSAVDASSSSSIQSQISAKNSEEQ